MVQVDCNPGNSVDEASLRFAVQQNNVDELTIRETADGLYYITFRFITSNEKEWYLVTYRNRNSPKMFKDLTRLNKHLKEFYSNIRKYLVYRSTETADSIISQQ